MLVLLVVSLSTVSDVYADTLEVIRPQLILLMELSALVHHSPCPGTSCILYVASFFGQNGWASPVKFKYSYIQYMHNTVSGHNYCICRCVVQVLVILWLESIVVYHILWTGCNTIYKWSQHVRVHTTLNGKRGEIETVENSGSEKGRGKGGGWRERHYN